ncbi:MAG TPA: hypothetical protein VJS92_07925 [Candidatus Polarisedimenticolaceae bacterium]|nr:hypothetical protein [Candidatus Polarisedimenticolaceae bacterium]
MKLGLVLGLTIGFPDKRAALRAPSLTSLPDAIITKAYLPILVTGRIFGALAGWAAGRWGADLAEAG